MPSRAGETYMRLGGSSGVESSSAGAAVGVRPSPGQLGLAGCPEVSSGIDSANY